MLLPIAGSAICVATKADQNAGAAEEHPFPWVALATFPATRSWAHWCLPKAGMWEGISGSRALVLVLEGTPPVQAALLLHGKAWSDLSYIIWLGGNTGRAVLGCFQAPCQSVINSNFEG